MKSIILTLALCLSLTAMSCSNDEPKPAAAPAAPEAAATTQPEAKTPVVAPEKAPETPAAAPAAPEAAAPATGEQPK